MHPPPQGGGGGWKADGTFVDALPGALAVSPLGPPEQAVRNVPLVIPPGVSIPQLAVNCRGAHYTFHAAGGGTMLPLEEFDAAPGERDSITPQVAGSTVQGMRFRPQSDRNRFAPRIGMVLGENKHAVFEWSGLHCPAGQATEFIAKPRA